MCSNVESCSNWYGLNGPRSILFNRSNQPVVCRTCVSFFLPFFVPIVLYACLSSSPQYPLLGYRLLPSVFNLPSLSIYWTDQFDPLICLGYTYYRHVRFRKLLDFTEPRRASQVKHHCRTNCNGLNFLHLVHRAQIIMT